jgi:hypothetical protein
MERTGIRTTEFWLTALVVLAGLIPTSGLIPEGHWAVKICGLVVSVAAALGYTWQRGNIKGAAKLLLVAVLVGLATGCAGPGYIRADSIAPAIEIVTMRHDRMLRGELDPAKIAPDDAESYLRTSALLRSVVDEATRK